MSHLFLVRHGQSEWNLQKKFTGWVDVDLAPQAGNWRPVRPEKL